MLTFISLKKVTLYFHKDVKVLGKKQSNNHPKITIQMKLQTNSSTGLLMFFCLTTLTH